MSDAAFEALLGVAISFLALIGLGLTLALYLAREHIKGYEYSYHKLEMERDGLKELVSVLDARLAASMGQVQNLENFIASAQAAVTMIHAGTCRLPEQQKELLSEGDTAPDLS